MTTSKCDLTRSALIVVDFQEDFCPPNGSLAVSNGRDISTTVNRLLSLPFALKVATQDWHPKDHISFASTHPAPDNIPFESCHAVTNPLNPSETETIKLWPVHCVQGTKGAQIVPELDMSKLHSIIQKGQDKRVEMLSGFKDTFKSPCVAESGLLNQLKAATVDRVYIVGLAADFCVRYTAIHAAENGYETIVIEEGTKAVDHSGEAMKRLSRELMQHGVRVLHLTDTGLFEV